MLLQISRFWADSASYDDRLGRYRIKGVMGPDEYHDAYPDAVEPGLDDNAYTNVTAAWVLARTLEVLRHLPEPRRRELAERTGLDEAELDHWDHVSRSLHVQFHDGVISQFEGYGELAELDWRGYRRRYGDIRRLDRILEAEGDTVNRYQASKQADVLMLGYLFSPDELQGVFRRLGLNLDERTWRRTVDYYLHRTTHGSSAQRPGARLGPGPARRADAWKFCQEALQSDIADIQGGTTGEGIHLGAMAGTLDLVQRGLTGLETRGGALWLDPVPLPELSSYGFTIRYHGHWGVRLRLESSSLEITVPARRPLPDRGAPARTPRGTRGPGRDGPAGPAGMTTPDARPGARPAGRPADGPCPGPTGCQAPLSRSMSSRSTIFTRSRPCGSPSAFSAASRRYQPSQVV